MKINKLRRYLRNSILACGFILTFLATATSPYRLVEAAEPGVSNPAVSARIQAFLKRDIEGLDSRYSPLRSIGEFRIPESYHTVEEAMNFLLEGSGFYLCSMNVHKPESKKIMGAALPGIHRSLIDVTLLEAIKILVGPHHDILVDPLTREIGFALNDHGLALPAAE